MSYPLAAASVMCGSACRLQRQTMLLQNPGPETSALRLQANCSTSLYLSLLISEMGLRILCLSRMAGELNKQCKALRRKSVSYFIMLIVLFMFLYLAISTELRGKVRSTARDKRTPQGVPSCHFEEEQVLFRGS